MKKKAKQIPVSNYVEVALGVLVTVLLAFLLRNWYIGSINYELSQPIIKETLLSEINQDEVYNYLREKEDSILYIGVVSDKECRSFEKEFNAVIKDRMLEDVITYLNITSSNNRGKFIKEFNKFYGTKLLGYPSLVIIEEGEVKDILTVKTGKSLDVDSAIKFLDSNGVLLDNND